MTWSIADDPELDARVARVMSRRSLTTEAAVRLPFEHIAQHGGCRTR